MPPDEADFDDCLGQSVERASLYLDPSNGSKEVAPGVSYATLDDMVSTLRSQIIAGPAAAAAEGDPAAFNFFGEPSSGGGSSSKAEADGAAKGMTPREAPPPPPAPQPSNGNGNFSSFQPPAATAAGAAGARGREELSGYQQQQQQQQQQQRRPPTSPATSARSPTKQQQDKLGLPMSGQVGPLGPPAAPPAVGIDVTPPPPRSSPSLGHRGGSSGSQAPAEDLGLGSPTPGQLGRQASQMEEGVLPPVAANQPSHLQQAGPQQHQHQVDQAAFPKRERRPRPQSSSRGPAPAAGGGIPPPSSQQPRHRHSELGSPPLRHLQQQQLLRSPFPQQPTPPLTPVQMGMGHGLGLSPAAPVPSPSPPGPNLPGPSRGSPNLTYGNNGGGWGGYAQPPPPPPQLQQRPQGAPPTQHHHHHHHQHHRHQHPPLHHQHHQQQQQHSYRPPMHPSPSHAPRSHNIGGRGGGGGVGGAPWSDAPPVMPPYPAAAGVPSSHQPGMVNGAMRHNNNN
ncbi:unnamed protein product, partial [Ectocarpus fasciculatus]